MVTRVSLMRFRSAGSNSPSAFASVSLMSASIFAFAVAIPGSEFTLDVDTVIVAVGNASNPLIPATTDGLEVNKRGNIVVNPETNMTSIPGVFAGGDIVLGAATVILAMGEGRRAAAGINAYLTSGK